MIQILDKYGIKKNETFFIATLKFHNLRQLFFFLKQGI